MEQKKIDFKPKVMEYIQRNGPALPIQISKLIERDTLIASAVLSELVTTKKLLISAAKVGGSPLYFLQGQEYRLQSLLYPYIKEKEKEAFDLLKKNLVLRDRDLEPAHRVALRMLRDFAVPIEVKDNEVSQIFWKWYVFPDDDAKQRIMKSFGFKEEKKEIKEEIKQAVIEKPLEIKEEIKEEPKEEKPGIITRIKERIKRQPKQKGVFEEKINDYLKRHNIQVLSSEIIKKDKEVNMLIKMPSVLGDINLFLKAINKAKITNTDLLMANNEARNRHMQALLLTNGSANKKVLEFLEKKLNNQLIFKQLK